MLRSMVHWELYSGSETITKFQPSACNYPVWPAPFEEEKTIIKGSFRSNTHTRLNFYLAHKWGKQQSDPAGLRGN